MSDLLQQAIIDATALKEAAIKNAENTLVEKYSQEFKETVQKLLEQEEAAQPQADVSSPPLAQATPPLDMGASSETDKKDAFRNVKSAFLDGPEDELITINFDQIKNTMMEIMGHEEEKLDEVYDVKDGDPTEDALAAGKPEQKEYELEESFINEEELEEGETELEAVESLEEIELVQEDTTAAQQALTAAEADKAKKEAAATQQVAVKKADLAKAQAKEQEDAAKTKMEESESIELTEEELSELAEELRVDLKPESQGRGYMGSTTVEKQKLMDVERAAARDDAAIKAREEELKKMEDLVKENSNLKSLNNKMMSALETLKEQVEKINVSNAKLLYTNKALGNISLNERQKNQIVESISKADSVLEAKTIYETIQNAVENLEAKKEVPQTLSETLNRSVTPFVVKKSSGNSLNDLMSERMKALAGIKKQ